MRWIDCESVGLMGPMVLFQYADDDGPVRQHHVWRRPVRETLELMEETCDLGYTVWNGVFDHYKIQQIHSLFSCLSSSELDEVPNVGRIVQVERRAVFQNCIKPRHIRDLYIHACREPFQALMDRKPIKIRRVPAILAQDLVDMLDERLKFDPIYFARKKEGQKWKVEQCKDNVTLCDLTLSFGASKTLKAVHKHVTGQSHVSLPIPQELVPVQERRAKKKGEKKDKMEWYPYSDGRPGTWPEFVQAQADYWENNAEARKYADDDVIMLRDLAVPLGDPDPDDTDSVLAACVASVRYRGFAVDLARAQAQYTKALATSTSVGSLDWRPIKKRLLELCQDEMEKMGIVDTKDETLEALSKWEGSTPGVSHPVAEFAAQVQAARKANFDSVWLRKLLIVGRFHPSFQVHGALTRRMSGSGGFNPQNISKEPEMRAIFILADTPEYLADVVQRLKLPADTYEGVDVGDWATDGGDFDGFETALALATWRDETLDSIVASGLKVYHLFGSYLYVDALGGPKRDQKLALQRIKLRCLTPEQHDVGDDHCKCNKIAYADRAKNCWYAYVYGAQEMKVAETGGVSIEQATWALNKMSEDCVGMKAARQAIFDQLTCTVQTGERGRFEWQEPDPIVTNMLGYRRSFEQEVQIVHALFDLANSLPQEWRELDYKVVRKDKEQTVLGAVLSALFGAMKSIENRVKRQAGNTLMQSTGATICKELQVKLWNNQPYGVAPWVVVPMNVHDELEAARRRALSFLTQVVEFVESYRALVPHINMEWKEGIQSWAER